MASENPTHVLTDARTHGMQWRAIVRALRELTSKGSFDSQKRPWIEVAASLTGYTVAQLRQAQRTYTAIERFIEKQDLPLHALDWPLSNLEVISRIAKLSPQRAETILISTTQKTWRELNKIHATLREEAGSAISPMSAGHRSARTFINALSEALSEKRTIQNLLGQECIPSSQLLKAWPGRYLFAHPDFFTGYTQSGTFRLAAFEGLRCYGKINLQAAANAASKAAVEATFFARYYWCLSTRQPAGDLVKMRDLLGLLNVGIIVVESGRVEIISKPTGSPLPNRQDMLLEDPLILKRLGFEA